MCEDLNLEYFKPCKQYRSSTFYYPSPTILGVTLPRCRHINLNQKSKPLTMAKVEASLPFLAKEGCKKIKRNAENKN
jgi:hypothetical protein